jgi:fatty-acyl-CoA synthase
LNEWLADRAAHFRDAPAVLTSRRTFTYAEIEHASTEFALALAKRGVRAGDHVGVLLPNSAEWLAIAWATWRLRAVLVPLNTLWSGPELGHALRQADVHFLVAARTFLRHDYTSKLGSLGIPSTTGAISLAGFPALRAVLWADEFVAFPAPERPLVQRQCGADLQWLTALAGEARGCERAAIFFTSGSEAAAKAVVHTHASMLAAATGIAQRLGLTPRDRTWAYLPFFFAGGLVAFALASLGAGAALLVQEVFDPEEAVALMERYGCTTLFAWPHQAEAIARHPRFDRQRIGIRKGPGAQAPWAERIFAEPHAAVSAWGMTETGPLACVCAFDDPLEVRKTTHGRPLPGVEVAIADPDSGDELPRGARGEILVRGATLMESYYRRRPQDCVDARGFFHTGDLGWLDEQGFLHFAGRMREVIKTAGANVSPSEVEAVLCEHPGVALAVVVPVSDPERGENVAAFVVAAGIAPSEEELSNFCRSRLAAYKMPRHFFFVEREELPSAGSGKYDKRALRRRAEELLARGQHSSRL